MMSLSSPAALWLIINQLQLLMLLLLTGAYIPTDIVKHLCSSQFSTFSFSFIPFNQVPGVEAATEWTHFEQQDHYLDEMGLESGSSLNNNFSLFVTVTVIVPLHLLVWGLRQVKLDVGASKTKKVCAYVLNKAFEALTFNLYVRLFLEAYQHLLLSSASELYLLGTDSAPRIVSLSLAGAILFA